MIYETKRQWTNGVISYPAGRVIAEGDLPPNIIEKMAADGAFDEPVLDLPFELTVIEANVELEEIG